MGVGPGSEAVAGGSHGGSGGALNGPWSHRWRRRWRWWWRWRRWWWRWRRRATTPRIVHAIQYNTCGKSCELGPPPCLKLRRSRRLLLQSLSLLLALPPQVAMAALLLQRMRQAALLRNPYALAAQQFGVKWRWWRWRWRRRQATTTIARARRRGRGRRRARHLTDELSRHELGV